MAKKLIDTIIKLGSGTLLPEAIIKSENLNHENGHIELINGLMICWKKQRVTAGGVLWDTSTKLWYSNHSLGNWSKSFKTIIGGWSNVYDISYWSTYNGYTATNSGTVRVYRPNANTTTTEVFCIAFGLTI